MNLRPILVADVVITVFVSHQEPGKCYSMANLGAKALPVTLALLFAFSANSCVTANSAEGSDITLPESRSLIGFDAVGAMLLLRESREERAILSFDLPSGPERTILSFDGPVTDTRMRALIREQGWRTPETWQANAALGLWFHVDEALGDRRTMAFYAQADGVSVLLMRVPIAGSTDVDRISRSPDDTFAIIEMHTHGQKSVFVIDLRDARSTLLNKRALDAYAGGDHQGAATLLERAVEANPRAGDAIYNLACVHALLGEVYRAADELQIAFALDPARYRRLAKKDPDLAAVRELPAIRETLGVP